MPENETSSEGPVGLYNGESIRIHDVSKVRQVPFEDCLAAKQAGKMVGEEENKGYVYWAVKVDCDVPVEKATAWVTVLKQYKSGMQ